MYTSRQEHIAHEIITISSGKSEIEGEMADFENYWLSL